MAEDKLLTEKRLIEILDERYEKFAKEGSGWRVLLLMFFIMFLIVISMACMYQLGYWTGSLGL